MAEHAPLTKQERERLHTRIHTNVERALAEYDDDDWADMCMRGLGYILRYEATVAALEAENAELRPLAEVGRAVAGMAVGDELRRGNEMAWTLTRHNDIHRHGFTALAALRAAKGE